jgi:pilus assembly protein CpaE
MRGFGQLVEEMERELGEAWADMSIPEAIRFLEHDIGAALDFIALAVARVEAKDHKILRALMKSASLKDVRVILIAHDMAKDSLDALLSLGVAEVIPFPLADGALRDAMSATPGTHKGNPPADANAVDPAPRLPGQAALFAVQALAGGTGASTLATNLAWELATIDKRTAPSVCLVDLNLQHATVSAYLDLPRRDMVLELFQDAQSMDVDGFKQALVTYEGRLSVLTAPTEIVPLDLLSPGDVDALLNLAAQCFDIVVIDMPQTLVMWTETVLTRADVYFATLEIDLRSAQNALRVLKALQSEGLPTEKLNIVLNRAPGLTDLAGRSRVHRLADTLGVSVATLLPDGGRAVSQAGDSGTPMAVLAPKNPLRREIAKLAQGLYKALLRDSALAS